MEHLTAGKVMTPDPVTVSINDSLRDVGEVLLKHSISGVPVVDGTGVLVGILSERDLLDEDRRRGALPRTALFGTAVVSEDLLLKAYENGMQLRAHNVMTTDVICVDEDTPAEAVARMMMNHRVNRIPVVRDGKPVGIVTRSDLLSAMINPSDGD